ncbi:DUF2497 domain-containing protein [Rhodomicrobium vannielii ATCC 17100]|uniref:DUF2497 domain-containing protein n=1 Tax=Rhodomicrobium vannielii TaxID=1069 RepID=UPI0019189ECD|nr:DUF2497 domain-containing protein [Rhodomicrobium vannielii]MBJ7533391.1 DUF2497 domain-containing protein [Rhodomicrobium vannielii ATCC 17100]
MNRADQAPEPSMEEILASIRSIIADDGKPSAAESARAAPAGSLAAPVEEDVLDLTEELVFPVERAAASTPPVSSAPEQPALHRTRFDAQPAASDSRHGAVEPNRQAAERAEPEPAAHAIASTQEALAGVQAMPPMERVAAHLETPRPETYRPEPPRPEADPREAQPRPAQATPRSIWSRREMPGSPAPSPALPVTPRAAAEPPVRPQKRWAEDIHMAIPAGGPVPLIPQDIQPRAEETAKLQTVTAPEHEATAAEPEDSAMAMLTERLARDAVSAMDAEELTQAGEVDFAALEDERKAEVTESFASAIERQSEGNSGQPLPSLLDEVLRHDFRRDADEDDETEARAAAAASEPEIAHDAPAESEDASVHAPTEAVDTTPVEDAEPEAAQPVFETEHFREIEEARSEDLPSEEAQADEAATDEPSVEQDHFEQEFEPRFEAPVERGPRPDFAPWLVASPVHDEPASAFLSSEPEAEREPQPQPEPAREEVEPPLAQARFIGAEPSSYAQQLVTEPSLSYAPQVVAAQAPAPAPAPSQATAVPPAATGPLEAAVREMLRPMLVQWLNENMPRILESAIREEIASRGVLPKPDDQV